MNYDIAVVGSGPGGYVAAIRAAQLGKRVAVIERADLGGICLNWGCIPSKALLKSAQVYKYAKNASQYGIDIEGEVKPDIQKIVARSRGVSDTMRNGVAFLLKKNNVDVIMGGATLMGNGRISVIGDQNSEVTAEHIILATGARAREMPFMPMDGEYIINYRQAMTLSQIPQTMAIVGSGAIGCEFAYFYASLGTKVTIIEFLPNILPLEDEEVSKQMERSFRKMGVNVMVSSSVKEVKVDNGRCLLQVESKGTVKEMEASIVLSAVGIKSNIEYMGLEELGIKVERDKVVVDQFYRTSSPGVYAIGDIIPTPALAHVASMEGICCVEAICGLNPDPIDYTTVPACVFTNPEIASVGMRERDAIEKGYEIKVGKFPFMASGKATAIAERDGFAKLIFDAKTDKLLGAHLIGSGVSEMLGEAVIAKHLGATAKTIAQLMHSHPTMHEAVMEAAEAADGHAINM